MRALSARGRASTIPSCRPLMPSPKQPSTPCARPAKADPGPNSPTPWITPLRRPLTQDPRRQGGRDE
eukprot:7083079-Alexandrium_andersonii.AAC.1